MRFVKTSTSSQGGRLQPSPISTSYPESPRSAWRHASHTPTDWILDILLPRDITQVRIFQPDAVVQEHFHAGEIIFDEGDFGDKLYVIIKGEVEVIVNGNAVATLKDGEVFGELALVSSITRTAKTVAKTDLDLISVSLSAFQQLVTHLPGVKSSINEIMKQHGVDPEQLEVGHCDDKISTAST